MITFFAVGFAICAAASACIFMMKPQTEKVEKQEEQH